MNYFFSQIWMYLTLLSKKVKFSHVLLVLYALGALVCTYVFININRIPIYDIYVDCKKLSNISNKEEFYLDIAIGDNADKKYALGAPTCLVLSNIDCDDSIGSVFSEEKLKTDTITRKAYELLTEAGFRKDLLDSATSAYDMSIGFARSIGSMDAKVIYNTTIDNPNSHPVYVYNGDTIINGKQCSIARVIMTCINNEPFLAYLPVTGGLLGSGSIKRQLLMLEDISQCVVKLHLRINKIDTYHNKSSIDVDMTGPVRFSAIYPTPDKIGMSSISYNDSRKISEIKSSWDLKEAGLKFYAQRLDRQYLQSAKVYFITTFLGLFLTLFIKSLCQSLYGYIKKLIINKKQKD